MPGARGEQPLDAFQIDREAAPGERIQGIAAPAPICPDPSPADDPTCQVIVAPSSPGARLVPDTSVASRASGPVSVGTDGEIRLTYGQLTALVDEAVRQLADVGKA